MQIHKPFQFPKTDTLLRKDKCAFCCKEEGNLVGRVNYIGLSDFDMVQCSDCGLVSIDPIPSSEIVAEGCKRLYRLEQPNEKRTQLIRGFSKSFRRGARFARKHLKSQIKSDSPLRILEVGAGDGYFSQGIKQEFPKSDILLMDIVPDLTQYYESQFGCKTKTGEFNAKLFAETEKFDLIIFRDLLEHVRNPFEFLNHCTKVLANQGKILFITPNGKEDFWLINQNWIHGKQPTLLMLNHFHYFLPETLDAMLKSNGFVPRVAFKWGLKQYRKGLGWKQFTNCTPFTLPQLSERKDHSSITEIWKHKFNEVSSAPLNNLGLVSTIYSYLVDREPQKVHYFSPKGHEFFVFAEKTTD